MTSPRGFYPAVERTKGEELPAPSNTSNYCSGNTPLYYLGNYLLGTVLHSPISFPPQLVARYCHKNADVVAWKEVEGCFLPKLIKMLLEESGRAKQKGVRPVLKPRCVCLLNRTQGNHFFRQTFHVKEPQGHTICVGNNLAARVTSWAGIWCQSNQGMQTSCALLQGSISARHTLNHTAQKWDTE